MAQSSQTAVAGDTPLTTSVGRGRIAMVLAGVMLGMLLSALDQTIVGTAMPRIIAELNGLQHYAWVFTSYLLASTVSVPIYGKLSDIYGRRPFFLLGMIVFLIGSALSGTSQDMTQLIIYRGIQGLGAGAMMPIAQAIIGDIFPPAERGKWQGLMMAVFGLASIVGPTMGGWITDNWGWRWVFYVNMPVGAVAIATAGLALPRLSHRQQHQIDYWGALALGAATVPLLLAFSWAGTQYAWGSAQVVGLFVFSAVMFVTLYFLESHAAEPIISPSLFKNSVFTVSTIATFLVSIGFFGAILYLPLFVQGVIGDSATNSGVVLTPMMLGFIVSSVIGGQIMSRTGRYKVLALVGFAIAAIGVYLLSQMGAGATNVLIVRNMIITGLGMGVMMSLFTIVVQNAFPFTILGSVTANLQFFRSIGGTIGVAVLGTAMTDSFQSGMASKLPSGLARSLPPQATQILQNPQVLLSPSVTTALQQRFASVGPQGQTLFAQLLAAVRDSLATAIAGVFEVSFAMMVLGFIATLFLREIPLRKSHLPNPTEAKQAAERQRLARSQALLGTIFAMVSLEAQKPEASPTLLDTVASLGNGSYPAEWGVAERARAAATDILEPTALALLAPLTVLDLRAWAAYRVPTPLEGFEELNFVGYPDE